MEAYVGKFCIAETFLVFFFGGGDFCSCLKWIQFIKVVELFHWVANPASKSVWIVLVQNIVCKYFTCLFSRNSLGLSSVSSLCVDSHCIMRLLITEWMGFLQLTGGDRAKYRKEFVWMLLQLSQLLWKGTKAAGTGRPFRDCAWVSAFVSWSAVLNVRMNAAACNCRRQASRLLCEFQRARWKKKQLHLEPGKEECAPLYATDWEPSAWSWSTMECLDQQVHMNRKINESSFS